MCSPEAMTAFASELAIMPATASSVMAQFKRHRAEATANDAEHGFDHFVAVGHEHDDAITVAKTE